MSEKPNGGFAFPSGITGDSARGINLSSEFVEGGGMTLRDWFAGHALSGLLAMCAGHHIIPKKGDEAAQVAYALADAMIAERKR